MVGISSLSLSWADSFRGEEAAASGIGRHFRSGLGRRGRRSLYGCLGRFGSGDFGSFQLFGGRRIEDAAGERSERGLERRQNLLSRELISDSICERNSLEARRNSFRNRATWRPISGIFLGPKKISARNKMK